MFVRLTNDTTYLTGNEGQKFRAVFSENAPLQSVRIYTPPAFKVLKVIAFPGKRGGGGGQFPPLPPPPPPLAPPPLCSVCCTKAGSIQRTSYKRGEFSKLYRRGRFEPRHALATLPQREACSSNNWQNIYHAYYSAVYSVHADAMILKVVDQLECTDPARNDFLEPSGDSTHLVHCKGRPMG